MRNLQSIKAIELAVGDTVVPTVGEDDLVIVGKRAALTFEMRLPEDDGQRWSITYYGDEYVAVVKR